MKEKKYVGGVLILSSYLSEEELNGIDGRLQSSGLRVRREPTEDGFQNNFIVFPWSEENLQRILLLIPEAIGWAGPEEFGDTPERLLPLRRKQISHQWIGCASDEWMKDLEEQETLFTMEEVETLLLPVEEKRHRKFIKKLARAVIPVSARLVYTWGPYLYHSAEFDDLDVGDIHIHYRRNGGTFIYEMEVQGEDESLARISGCRGIKKLKEGVRIALLTLDTIKEMKASNEKVELHGRRERYQRILHLPWSSPGRDRVSESTN